MKNIRIILIACQLAIVYSSTERSSIDYSYNLWRDFYPDIAGVGGPEEPVHPTHEGMTPDLYHGCIRIGTWNTEADVGWDREERSDCLEREGLSYRWSDYRNDLYHKGFKKRSDIYDFRCYHSGCSNVSEGSDDTSMNGWLKHDIMAKHFSFTDEFGMMGLTDMHPAGSVPRDSLIPFIDKEKGGRYWPVPDGATWPNFWDDPFPGDSDNNFKSTSDDKGVHVGNNPSVFGETKSNLEGVRVQLYDSNADALPCWNKETGVQDEVVAAACHLDTNSARYTTLKAAGTCPVLDVHEAWASDLDNLTAINPQCLSNARHFHRSLVHVSNPWRFGLDGGCTRPASWMKATCDQHGFHCLDFEQPDGCTCVGVRVNFLCYENIRKIPPAKSIKSAVIDGIIVGVVTIVMLAAALTLMVFFIRRNSVQKHDYEKMLEKMAKSASDAAGDIGEASPES